MKLRERTSSESCPLPTWMHLHSLFLFPLISILAVHMEVVMSLAYYVVIIFRIMEASIAWKAL
jgi:hypothetical protein